MKIFNHNDRTSTNDIIKNPLHINGLPSANIIISVVIENQNDIPGVETVQLYIQYPSSIDQPKYQLKQYQKASFHGNEKQTIVMILMSDDLKLWNDNMNQWEYVDGEYQICIGSSVNDLKLQQTIVLQF
jgi:beta-glucosidase